QLGRQLNLPPSYLLIHRVTLSTIGVLCQLGATVRLREELEDWLPGFDEEEGSEGAGPDRGDFAVAAERAGVGGASGRESKGAKAAGLVPGQMGTADGVSDGGGVQDADLESEGDGNDQGGDEGALNSEAGGAGALDDRPAGSAGSAGSAEEAVTVPPGDGATGSEAVEEGGGDAVETGCRETTVGTDTEATNVGPNPAG
ncbi:AarF/ABC1/UbiB kinase family protein, partial [Streptomyces albidoflavus]